MTAHPSIVSLPHRNALSESETRIATDLFEVAVEHDRECEAIWRRIWTHIDQDARDDDFSSDVVGEYRTAIAQLCGRIAPAVLERARGASWVPEPSAGILFDMANEERDEVIARVFEEAGIPERYLTYEEKARQLEHRK